MTAARTWRSWSTREALAAKNANLSQDMIEAAWWAGSRPVWVFPTWPARRVVA